MYKENQKLLYHGTYDKLKQILKHFSGEILITHEYYIYFFHQITTFTKVGLALVFELQTFN